MAEKKSLEEAWRNHGLALTSEELDDTARALLLVGLEEARAIDEAPTMARAGLYEKQQRRIEALGK